MVLRPLVVAFDVNETLFSLDGVGRALDEVGAADGTLQRWFSQVLSDGFALTCAGDFVPFRELARHTLERMLDDDEVAATVLRRFAHLDPHPDVRPALERLVDAGVPAVTLTNGHADMTAQLLERAGLRHLVASCHDVGEVRRWKPAPLPYTHCAQRNEVTPERMAMVAVHSWDVHGARRAGLVTGYASRHEGGTVTAFEAADVNAVDLPGVVEGLLALPFR
ncbi:MAG TPA: haloacid dehalogenase type II [Euzebyales bacterium]|nr:haloacid dehalogenase type II [Euzebyales bacterium]